MNIGIDISQIVYKGTGVGRFTQGLVDAILSYDTDNQWTFFFSGLRQNLETKIEKKIKDKGYTITKWPLPPTALSLLWNDVHWLTSFEMRMSRDLDWFITSDWTEPPLRCKKATIVHDLVFKRYPETVDKKIIATQTKRLEWVTKESEIVFADSHSTKDDLRQFQHINAKKIQVIYPGVDVAEPLSKDELFQKHNLKDKYILSVGKIEPRKNLKSLITAFNGIKDDIQLVIVGPAGWESIDETLDKRIRYLGFVSEEELAALYKNAQFFIFPSIWEGFGYPAVEAMKLGCPIALSNTSSLKELGEGVAHFFDPHDVSAIKNSLQTMIIDENLRNSIRAKGLEKSHQFSWENYYNQFMKTLSSNN